MKCPDNKDWFVKQLADLSQEMENLRAQVKKCDCNLQNVKIEASGGGNEGVDEAIKRALWLYDADKIGIADYALESGGMFLI